MNFLFDVLNFLCGLGALNKRLFEQHFFSGDSESGTEGSGSELVVTR